MKSSPFLHRLAVVFVWSLFVACGSQKEAERSCTPGDGVCFVYSEFLLICRDDGSGWDVEACPENTLCYLGECQEIDCVPGATECQDDGLISCSDDGSQWSEPIPCSEDSICHDGECQTSICTSGSFRCRDTNQVERCNTVGTEWDLFVECEGGSNCVDGICLPELCTAGYSECGPTTLYVCQDDGSWNAQPCPPGQPCILGRCLECLEDSDCGEWETCDAGVCNPSLPLITTYDLPLATVGVPFEAVLDVMGGRPPYTWSIAEGDLPSGISFNSEGYFEGTAESEGESPLLVRVTDSALQIDEREFTLQAVSTEDVRIVTRSLRRAKQGRSYDARLEAQGGVEPYAWQVFSGSLPPGIHLEATGNLSGTPEDIGTFPLSFRVLDASTPPGFDVREYELVVEVSPLEVHGDTEYDLLFLKIVILPTLVPILPYSTELEAQGGLAPYEWSEQPPPPGLAWLISDWGLPEGLTLGARGRVSGFVTDVSDAQSISLPIGPEIAGYFFVGRVTDQQSPSDEAEAIFCIPTVAL